MTGEQKRRRGELEKQFRADPKAVKLSFLRLLKSIEGKLKDRPVPLILYTDEKRDYQRALWDSKRGFAQWMYSGSCRHHMTNSQDARNRNNPLFPVNYFDREIRKDMASHARESVQFPRNVCNAMLRMQLYMFDHNVRKPYRINDPQLRLLRHARIAGADLDYLRNLVWGFFERRVFQPLDLCLSESARVTLKRGWITPMRENPEQIWKHLTA
jgi:hypothetical protein